MTGVSVPYTGAKVYQAPALTALRRAFLSSKASGLPAARRLERLCLRIGLPRGESRVGAARTVEVRYLVFIWTRSALGFWYRRPKLRLAHVDAGTARRLGRLFTLEDVIV